LAQEPYSPKEHVPRPRQPLTPLSPFRAMARCLLSLIAAIKVAHAWAGNAARDSLAVCVAGWDEGQLHRAMVHRSIRFNLLEGFGAARTDIFAEVVVATTEEADKMRSLLSDKLQARHSRVNAGSYPGATCKMDIQNPAFTASVDGPERFVQSWHAAEACFLQVLQAEKEDGLRYDWVLRVSPDLLWHGRPDALSSFSPSAVSVARQADKAFLSPRSHAEVAFYAVLDTYRQCDGGSLTVRASDGADLFLDALETLGVQPVHRTFRAVGLRPNAKDALARKHCLAASQEGLEEDVCMRLLYGRRPEPVLTANAPVQSDAECRASPAARPLDMQANVLIATPLKNAARFLPGFLFALRKLTYPKHLLSLALLISDSSDDTKLVAERAAHSMLGFRDVNIFEEDFNYEAPVDRHALDVQTFRRAVLAKSRNELIRNALRSDTFAVLWLDVDIVRFPATLVQDMLALGQPIVVPHILIGDTTYDKNSWRENYPEEAFTKTGLPKVSFEGYQRYDELAASTGFRDHMDVLRAAALAMGARDRQYAVRLHGVGAGVLLVEARVHRGGVLFSEEPYKHRLESEGFGLQAADRGFPVCGLPLYEVSHHDEWAEARRLQKGAGNATTSTTKAPSTTTANTTGNTTGNTTDVVRFTADIVMDNLTEFNATKLKESLAASANIDLDKVEIVSIDFKVEVVYTFGASITAAQAKTAIAGSMGVEESQVEVTVTPARRLADFSRRLAGSDVTAEITSNDSSVAESVKTKAANATSVVEKLAVLGVNTTATVKQAPVARVSVVTAVRGSTASASEVSAWATQAGTAVGGTVVISGVTGATPTPVPENSPAQEGTASAAFPLKCALTSFMGPALACCLSSMLLLP